jgi:hypothetical protein
MSTLNSPLRSFLMAVVDGRSSVDARTPSVTCHPSTTLQHVIAMLVSTRLHRMFVVDEVSIRFSSSSLFFSPPSIPPSLRPSVRPSLFPFLPFPSFPSFPPSLPPSASTCCTILLVLVLCLTEGKARECVVTAQRHRVAGDAARRSLLGTIPCVVGASARGQIMMYIGRRESIDIHVHTHTQETFRSLVRSAGS